MSPATVLARRSQKARRSGTTRPPGRQKARRPKNAYEAPVRGNRPPEGTYGAPIVTTGCSRSLHGNVGRQIPAVYLDFGQRTPAGRTRLCEFDEREPGHAAAGE